jgi:hypothetical protein
MKDVSNSVIDFEARRSERFAYRSNDADGLLWKLGQTRRLLKSDQETLVDNIGRLIAQQFPGIEKDVVRQVLEANEYEKRKRYIRLPDEKVSQFARFAASGGSFARIMRRLIELRTSNGSSVDQAKVEIVKKALAKTSFLPPAPFQMPDNVDDEEIAQFATDMNIVANKLADEGQLADFFSIVSKHPIFPTDAWYQWNNSLELLPNLDPNHLHAWVEDDQDELQVYIPWWAPKCLIGHWYIPFNCKKIDIPPPFASEVAKNVRTMMERISDFYPLIEPYLRPEFTTVARVYHRLPLWIIALPLPDRLIFCLYPAAHCPGGFYPNRPWPPEGDPLRPCFVSAIGQSLNDDDIYFGDDESDDLNTVYVYPSESKTSAIGTYVDDAIANFRSNLSFVDMERDLPKWLQEHPVHRLLQLTSSSETAMQFALSPRKFCGRSWDRGDQTRFRPTWADPVTQHRPGPSQDSIAAYLLRNLLSTGDSTFFSALKSDALAKHGAAREVINKDLLNFRQAFKNKYET